MSKIVKTILKTLKIVLTVIVVIVLGAVIIQRVSNNKVNLFGHGIYTIVSESMKPEYEIGDMFLSKEIKYEDIKVGDDIVYIGKASTYEGKTITHRVIRIDDGTKTIYTKGINNTAEDPGIKYDQVCGRVVYKFFLLSIFSRLMNNSVLFYIIIFVPFTLLVFFDIKAIIKDKRALEQSKNKLCEEETQEEIEILGFEEEKKEKEEENINQDINNNNGNNDNNVNM